MNFSMVKSILQKQSKKWHEYNKIGINLIKVHKIKYFFKKWYKFQKDDFHKNQENDKFHKSQKSV